MFDYVEFVAEYAPYDLYALENLGRAVDLFPHMTGMMKIEQEPRTYLAIRALGSGIQNLLFADPRTAADGEACVRAPRRGAGDGRHPRRRDAPRRRLRAGGRLAGLRPGAGRRRDRLMIEKKPRSRTWKRCSSVPGIDMVQFGPADYSMSIGLAGQWTHPAVVEAERYMIETALKRGIARAPRSAPGRGEALPRHGRQALLHRLGREILFEWFKQAARRCARLLGGRGPCRPAPRRERHGLSPAGRPEARETRVMDMIAASPAEAQVCPHQRDRKLLVPAQARDQGRLCVG